MKKIKRGKTALVSRILNESTILFFKKYILTDMGITTPIDNMMLCKIEDKLYEYEDDNINEDGTEKTSKHPFFERNKQASEILAELHSIWNDGDIDYDNLNKRLGLI